VKNLIFKWDKPKVQCHAEWLSKRKKLSKQLISEKTFDHEKFLATKTFLSMNFWKNNIMYLEEG